MENNVHSHKEANMKSIKNFIIIFIIAVLCLAFIGCGSEEKKSNSSNKDSDTINENKTSDKAGVYNTDDISSYSVSGNIIYYEKSDKLYFYDIDSKENAEMGGKGKIFSTPWGTIFVDEKNVNLLENEKVVRIMPIPEKCNYAAYDGTTCYFIAKEDNQLRVKCFDNGKEKTGYVIKNFETAELYPDETNLWVYAGNNLYEESGFPDPKGFPVLLCTTKNNTETEVVIDKEKDLYCPDEDWGSWHILQGKKGVLAENSWNVNSDQHSSGMNVYFLKSDAPTLVFPSGGSYYDGYAENGYIILNNKNFYLIDEQTQEYKALVADGIPSFVTDTMYYNGKFVITRGIGDVSFRIHYEDHTEEINL